MRLAHVAQRVGDRRHLDMAGHAVVRLGDAVVGVGHLGWAVKNVVRGDGRGNSVNLAAEGGHRVTVNCRVVNLHRATEGVVNNPAARHNYPLRHRRGIPKGPQQQRQQYIAEISTLSVHNNDRINNQLNTNESTVIRYVTDNS